MTALPATAGAGKESATSRTTDYVVLLADGADRGAALAAISKAGGSVVQENSAIGTILVRSNKADFARNADASTAVQGVARNRSIGVAPRSAKPDRAALQQAELRRAVAARNAGRGGHGKHLRPEPLADLQWDMKQIGATVDGSYAKERGDRGVVVGIMDTGIEGSHPDIAPNFSQRLSRNFTTDIPLVDGPCEVPSCVDPADVDDNGHGTHVASTIGSPINGLGIAGVAPKVTLANIRAGQDSGFFFLQPTLDAFVYAGRAGIDVVNMSFFTDPWLYNCANHPDDSPEEQAEQRTIVRATQRAANFARQHGVTLVAAEGNEGTDLGNPTFDDISPDFPPGNEKERVVDNSCITVPTETRGVIAVASTGPSTRKAYYSNFGVEQTDVAAPGGDAFDSPDHNLHVENLVLAAYPERLALLNGDITEPCGAPTNAFVVLDRKGDVCAYYQYLQGTSMASPHAVGVASLIVSRFGHRARHGHGLTLNPRVTEAILLATATKTACPPGGSYTYILNRSTGTVTFTHTCEGPKRKNGFYGHGIVNAARAAGVHHH
jgi:lantibiotic leader peptide-processing serine protease